MKIIEENIRGKGKKWECNSLICRKKQRIAAFGHISLIPYLLPNKPQMRDRGDLGS